MKINHSGAKYSAIVKTGEKLRNVSKQTGTELLYLNRGINSVCLINLQEVISAIDFNTPQMQFYPPNRGRIDLRKAINDSYFSGKSSAENIFITQGATGALSLSFEILNIDKVVLPRFYWGAYVNLLAVKQVHYETYNDFEFLKHHAGKLKHSAVIICEPNNPLGNKHNDADLIEVIDLLNQNGTVVIIDSPYRRVFFDETDTFYSSLLGKENVIIIESFSKSFGLSGQRIGFIHSQNQEFFEEFNIRLLYATNGINGFSQELVYQLLTSPQGKKAVNDFKTKTVKDIQQNIQFLRKNNLLAEDFYKNSKPTGIFVIVKRSQEELLKYNIGSVDLDYFTDDKFAAKGFARICVSVPHEKFKRFFEKILE